jgi:hypothetical protein
MIYLATLLHKKGNSSGLCKEGGFLLLLLSIWIGFSPHCFLEILPGFSPQCSLEIGFSWLPGFSPHCSLEIGCSWLPGFSLPCSLGDWIIIVVSVMYYGMVKSLPIMLGKAPSEPVMAS